MINLNKNRYVISLFFAIIVFFGSCVSTTTIVSEPPGAKVYLNGMNVGKTPYRHSDTKIVGSTTSVRLELEGYEPLNTSFSRDEAVDVGAIIGGLFVWVPFLWTMKYDPVHNYELTPLFYNKETYQENRYEKVKKSTTTLSKADQLRELKQLLDEKIITQEEFDREKKKILESND